MAKLIYSAITSLDGYVEDSSGSFEWAAPDEEVHAFVNDLERAVGTYLYGRRMYETMAVWQTWDVSLEPDFAELWRKAEKVVYSTTLTGVTTPLTRIEHSYDPAAVQALKAASAHEISIGGPGLAAHAIRAGLVDEYHPFVHPIMVGDGKSALPIHETPIALELVDEHRFSSGVIHLHYRNRT